MSKLAFKIKKIDLGSKNLNVRDDSKVIEACFIAYVNFFERTRDIHFFIRCKSRGVYEFVTQYQLSLLKMIDSVIKHVHLRSIYYKIILNAKRLRIF